MARFRFFGGIATICIFSEWGVTEKFFGLLLVCNQALLVLVSRRWPCWDLREEMRTAESILQVGTAKLLVWRRWSRLERVSGKIAYWYSA
jgi:hypothetical protein